jgi:hypothetical protein
MAINRDKPTTTKPSTPPVTFNLDDVNKIVSEALAKQAAAMAVAKPSNGKPSKFAENEWKAVKAFAKAGFGKVTPNVDVFTFNRWISKGFRPVEGSKAVKVNNLRLFCKKQVRPLTDADKGKLAEKEAKAEPRSNGKVATVTELHPQ